ncbi:MAG: hypothetical protein RL591_738, partial [Planctomycetota bacterium]
RPPERVTRAEPSGLSHHEGRDRPSTSLRASHPNSTISILQTCGARQASVPPRLITNECAIRTRAHAPRSAHWGFVCRSDPIAPMCRSDRTMRRRDSANRTRETALTEQHPRERTEGTGLSGRDRSEAQPPPRNHADRKPHLRLRPRPILEERPRWRWHLSALG